MGAGGGGMRGLAGPRRAAPLSPGPQTCSPSGARAGEEEDATAWRGRRGARPAPPPRRRRPRRWRRGEEAVRALVPPPETQERE
jgi:hypothetical protein